MPVPIKKDGRGHPARLILARRNISQTRIAELIGIAQPSVNANLRGVGRLRDDVRETVEELLWDLDPADLWNVDEDA